MRSWQAMGMVDDVAELLTIPEAAQALDVPVTRIHQYVRDGQLLIVRTADGVRRVPSGYIRDGAIVKGLSGVITVLRDGGYADDEIVQWLTRADDSLPGTPLQALRDNRGTEVKRRAQAAGF